MKIGMKEIAWELVPRDRFEELLHLAVGDDCLERRGISFPTMDLKLNVSYDDSGFESLLREKFGVGSPYGDVSHLTFVRNRNRLGFELPYKHYGYISEATSEALVFASSFGMLKSTISGYASLLVEPRGYVPVHASVLSANGKGLLLVGGSAAGKTTTLLNLVDWLLKSKLPVSVLTDDWAVIAEREGRYVAESFDPSVSLRCGNLDENRQLRFFRHDEIRSAVTMQKKISRRPDDLYGCPMTADKVFLDAVILLLPEESDGNLHRADAGEFSRRVVDSAYHYPYVSPAQVERHEGFWVGLAGRIPVYSFATRGFSSPTQSIEKIKEVIND